MKNIEVVYAPIDWNKSYKKGWTYHWEGYKGRDEGYKEFFATEQEAQNKVDKLNYRLVFGTIARKIKEK